MVVSLIVAVSQNRVIGKDNALLWYLPADLAYFKRTTEGHHVILGRKNYFSIPEKYRPLPNRTNIILTRSADFKADGCIVLNSLEEAIDYAKKQGEKELFIIGGGQVYAEALQKNLVDRLYITEIEATFEGDTFFPKLDKLWKKTSETHYIADDKNKYTMRFCIYEK